MEKTGTFTANCGKAALVKVTMSSSDALGSKFEQRSISKNTASLTLRHEAFYGAWHTFDLGRGSSRLGYTKNTGICPVKLYQSQCNTGMHFVKNYLMAKLWQNCPTIKNNAGFILLVSWWWSH